MDLKSSKNESIALESLHYYFDSQVKDIVDVSGSVHRYSKVMALNYQLMALSEEDFQYASGIISGLAGTSEIKNAGSDKDKRSQFRSAAVDLMERSLPDGGAASTVSVTKIEKI